MATHGYLYRAGPPSRLPPITKEKKKCQRGRSKEGRARGFVRKRNCVLPGSELKEVDGNDEVRTKVAMRSASQGTALDGLEQLLAVCALSTCWSLLVTTNHDEGQAHVGVLELWWFIGAHALRPPRKKRGHASSRQVCAKSDEETATDPEVQGAVRTEG